MVLDNIKVIHKSFGVGVVTDTVGNYITVKFDGNEKKFVYPDAFEKFLTLEDGSVTQEILSDIEKSKRAKQDLLDRKKEENLRAMTRGIVIPGKEAIQESEDEEYRQNKEIEE